METLGPPDSHFLSAALGWYELSNLPEAKAELDRIAPSMRGHPDVLEIRWLVHAQEKNWDEALCVARTLAEVAPERSSGWLHRAYALRRAKEGGLQAAWSPCCPPLTNSPRNRPSRTISPATPARWARSMKPANGSSAP